MMAFFVLLASSLPLAGLFRITREDVIWFVIAVALVFWVIWIAKPPEVE